MLHEIVYMYQHIIDFSPSFPAPPSGFVSHQISLSLEHMPCRAKKKQGKICHGVTKYLKFWTSFQAWDDWYMNMNVRM